MEFENRIQTREGLRDWITLQEKVILFGNESLAVTLLRYYILMNEKDKRFILCTYGIRIYAF